MTLEDETVLSAYLDGELDPSRRLMVEAALLSSPRLAARLQELSRLRDAIRGLSRPAAPPDLAASVLSRIEEAEALRRSRGLARRQTLRRLALLAPFSAAAAALLIMWGQDALRLREPELPPRPGGEPSHSVVPAPAVAVHEAPAPDAVPTPVAPAEVSVSLLGEPDPEAEKLARDEQGRFQEMLGRFDVQRFLLVVDRVDDASLRRVEEAIGLTHRTHPRHAEFRVAQGLALDPEHPGEAVIFAVVLDDTELRRFRRNMEDQFPGSGLAEAEPVAPALIAQLSEAGPFRFGEGQPVGSLVDTGRHDAVTAKREPANVAKARVVDESPVPREGYASPSVRGPDHRPSPGAIVSRGQRPYGEPTDTRPDPSNPPRDAGSSPDRRDGSPTLYLVWVTDQDSMPRRFE